MAPPEFGTHQVVCIMVAFVYVYVLSSSFSSSSISNISFFLSILVCSTGTLLFTYDNHQKSCWSLALQPSVASSPQFWLATAGTDSSIKVVAVSRLFELVRLHALRASGETVSAALRLALMHVTREFMTLPVSQSADAIRGVAILDYTSMLLITQSGNVWRTPISSSTESQPQQSWHLIYRHTSSVICSHALKVDPSAFAPSSVKNDVSQSANFFDVVALGDKAGQLTLISILGQFAPVTVPV
jgi:hypothetical protein